MAVIDRLRQLIGDNLGKNVVRLEPLKSQVNGTNKTFYVSRFLDSLGVAIYPLFPDGITGPFYVIADNTPNPTIDSFDLNVGYFVLHAAPANNVLATYYWQYFTDAQLNNWLNNDGVQFIGGGFATADLILPAALQTAAMMFVASLALSGLAAQAASQVDKKGGELSASFSARSKAWAAKSKELEMSAYKARDDFHTRQGFALEPSLAWQQFTGDVDQWTPAR